MHCNNGLNNKLVESLVENKVAQETGDLKYLQDSMYDFVKTLKEIILGEYSPEFFNKYVDEALKLHGSNLEEFLKIPKMGLELRQALNSIDDAIDTSNQEFKDNLVLLLDRFQTTLDNIVFEARDPYDTAVELGFQGTKQEWLEHLEGDSAYEIAVKNGYIGSEEDWLKYLEGDSAYKIAVDNGFVGTKQEWLISLKPTEGTLQALTLFMNNDADTEVTVPELGNIPSLQGHIKQIFENGGLPATPFATKALMLESELVDGTYAVVTNDAITDNGVYLKKSGAWSLVPWNNFASLDSLQINSGKVYPLVNKVRNNKVSTTNLALQQSLLGIKVEYADKGYYYRVAWYSNGATTYTDDGSSWIIEKIAKANYETAANTAINIVNLYQKQTVIVKNTGIQRIVLDTALGQNHKEKITVVVDSDKLPSSGAIIANNTNGGGYGYVVDESNVSTDVNYDKLEYPIIRYKNEVYPFVKKTYKTTTSAPSDVILSAFIDAKVINAESGYYYTLGFYANGSTAVGVGRENSWVILKRPLTLDSEVNIVDTFTEQPALVRGGIQKITLNSKGSEVFEFTIDTDALPAYGTLIKANISSNAGYSYVINPLTYSEPITTSSTSNKTNYIKYIASLKLLYYRYISNGANMEVIWGLNGANNLPNFRGISKSTDGKSLDSSVFTSVQATTTDWIPPMTFYAKEGDVGGVKDEFTGGNHLVGGEKTAVNTVFDVFIDDEPLDMSANFEGYVGDVMVYISNNIYASNTVTSKTPVIRQDVTMVLGKENVQVHCKNTALKELYLQIDYGAQMTSIGYQGTQLFVGGSQTARTAFDNTQNSGASGDYPNAWAVSLKSENGTLMSYMDRRFGVVSTGVSTASDKPLVRAGYGVNTKFYHSAWYSFGLPETSHLNLKTGYSYEWRGGYVIQAPKTSTYDTIAIINNKTVAIKDGSKYTTTP